MENRTLLDPKTYSPGYLTKDELWAAVPYGSKFMVLKKGEQGSVFPSLDAAKAFIAKQTKATTRVSAPRKPQKSKNPPEGTLTQFLK